MLDIDGFRIDKATQVTVDAMGDWSDHIRQCAKRFGKDNFFIPGEITGGNTFGSIYLGRGKEPKMAAKDLKQAVIANNNTARDQFIRDPGKNALDAGAFHYTIYRSLTRFLGYEIFFEDNRNMLTIIVWTAIWRLVTTRQLTGWTPGTPS